jgi:hypothetical protein
MQRPEQPLAPVTAAERASVRAFCESHAELTRLAVMLKAETAATAAAYSAKREATIEHMKLAGVPYTKVGEYFLRLVERPTARPISAAIVRQAVEQLTEEQVAACAPKPPPAAKAKAKKAAAAAAAGGDPPLTDSSTGTADRQRAALRKAVLTAVRTVRTTMHDALNVTVAAPVKKAEPVPLEAGAAEEDARAFIQARASLAFAKAKFAELRRLALKRKAEAEPVAAALVLRHAGHDNMVVNLKQPAAAGGGAGGGRYDGDDGDGEEGEDGEEDDSGDGGESMSGGGDASAASDSSPRPPMQFTVRVAQPKPRRVIMSVKTLAEAVTDALGMDGDTAPGDGSLEAWKSALLAGLMPRFEPRGDAATPPLALRVRAVGGVADDAGWERVGCADGEDEGTMDGDGDDDDDEEAASADEDGGD